MGYLMFNTFINTILTQWPYVWCKLTKGVENVTGLKAIAGIPTLDTNIFRWYHYFSYCNLDT